VSIEERSGRRLLAAAIVINLKISANDAAQAAQITTDLNIENINKELAKQGLRLATVTQAAAAVHIDSSNSNSDLLESKQSSNSTGWWDTLVRNPSAFYMPEGEYFIYAISAVGGLVVLFCCCCGAACARRRRNRALSTTDRGHDVEAEKGDLSMAEENGGEEGTADEVTRGLAFTDVPAEALNGEPGAEGNERTHEQGETVIGTQRSEGRDSVVDLENAVQETEGADAAAADSHVRPEIPSKNSHLWDTVDSQASSEKRADDDLDFEDKEGDGVTESSASHVATHEHSRSGNPFLNCVLLRCVYPIHEDRRLRSEKCVD